MSATYKVIIVVVAVIFSICSAAQSKAQYKNSEISLARGYGKRDLGSYFYNDDDERHPQGSEEFGDSKGRNGWEKLSPLSIDWLASELIANPKVLKAFLSRFFDANKNGKISVKELLGNANLSC